ncbi:MAG TPA: alpha-2-macroglobulin family protein, partial [Bacteroidia bacterium]|nr:alpha-2-macroglobulin family protein [Bacteroidia bacterium]
SYAIAMDDKKHSGRGYAQTKSYKNIMANLALPRFMLQGDSSNVIGKVLNYSNKNIKTSTQFKLNNIVISKHDTSVQNSVVETALINPTNSDSIKLTYLVEQYDGPKDGEERSIPVLPIGVEESKGVFSVLSKDSSFTISLDSGITEIYIQNNPIDFILKEIETLKNYPYWCMEQTASKLNALLMQEEIKNKLQNEFDGSNETQKLLNKLGKGQKNNGSWGWWEDSPDNVWMTAYILRIIHKAQTMYYNFKTTDKAKQYLLWNLSGLQGNELLTVLNTFSEMKVAVPYVEYLKKFEKDSLTMYQKFLIIKIKQENKLPYDLNFILKTKKETVLRSIYWGDDNYRWYDNSINTSLLAYKILETADSNNTYLPYIRNYFLEIKKENKWKNTVETANILETILPSFLKETGNKVKPACVTVSGAVNKTISEFPFKTLVNKGAQKLTVSKTGSSTVFFTSYQKQWNNHPQKKEDYYNIKTYYEVNGKKTETLTAGVTTDLVVEVNVTKKADYVMIEVPIPAGCSYGDNKFNVSYYEVHREYFKNKTSIFCQELAQGKHIFKIKLQPRFTGSYYLNPAKAELMYFPVFYGRNEIKKTNIK